MPQRPHLLFGVSGGIAAYKIPSLIRRLSEDGFEVRVVPTPTALDFVGSMTWEAIAGHPIHTELTADSEFSHTHLAAWADLIVIAPTTAHTCAAIRMGLASNLLLASVLASTAPCILAPEMHTAMWENPATQENMSILTSRGFHILDPAIGPLAGNDSGKGRLPDIDIIRDFVNALWRRLSTPSTPLAGKHALINAGGTQEKIDPVRAITNHSTGIFGVEIARECALRGASVTLVQANIHPSILTRIENIRAAFPNQIRIISTPDARSMHHVMREQAENSHVIICAAAVSDFRLKNPSSFKKKKTGESLTLELVENPDILRELVRDFSAPERIIVGFAAETGNNEKNSLELGREKARTKGADFTVINDVGKGKGFGPGMTHIDIADRTGTILAHADGTKEECACLICHTIEKALKPANEIYSPDVFVSEGEKKS